MKRRPELRNTTAEPRHRRDTATKEPAIWLGSEKEIPQAAREKNRRHSRSNLEAARSDVTGAAALRQGDSNFSGRCYRQKLGEVDQRAGST